MVSDLRNQGSCCFFSEMDITYFDLCSMLKMNADIIASLGGKVWVRTHTGEANEHRLNDSVSKDIEWARYQLDDKVLEVKVRAVEIPNSDMFFVFAEV